MADVAVENPMNIVLHKKPALTDTLPNIDPLEGPGNDNGDEYATLKRLQRHLEYARFRWSSQEPSTPVLADQLDRYIHLQEEYIKDEQR
jgi:26S proteasome regulatory subunit T3